MKILKIVLFLILGFNANSQIELFQLQWATDSSYVIGSLPSGEPIWVHRDSLGFGRIYDYNVTSVYYYDIINPQKGDIYIDDQYDGSQKSRYYDGSSWLTFDYDSHLGNEGVISLENISGLWNAVRFRSTGLGSGSEVIVVGDTLIDVTYDGIVPRLRLNIDTTQLNVRINNFISDSIATISDETQYLNPYVVTGDTVGFYLTVAVDTVLFENTIDTAAYCCPPSLSGDTLYIEDNYVVLPVANIVGGWGIDATESPANTWNLIADSSQVATQYDLSLVSGSQTLSIDSTNRVFTVSISGGNSVKFKDTGGIDSTYLKSGWGITIDSVGNTYTAKADTSKIATQYDLSQVSGGSSKVIDILASDFTTSATSLQTTDLAYTFPSTGTYEVKLYGTYTSSNTLNGILFGYVASGGLTASFVTGSHYIYDRSTSASGSTSTIRGVSALGNAIATGSVNTADSPLTIMSEILVTVSATGTLTFNFASESGSYSATLVAGRAIIVEKLD